MKKFVRQCHDMDNDVWLLYLVLVVFVAVLMIVQRVFPGLVIGVLAVLALLIWLADRYARRQGMTIDGEMVSFWDIRRKRVDPTCVAAIKITRAVKLASRYGPEVELKDKNGELLYTMFFLNCYMPWLMDEKSGDALPEDIGFGSVFREYIICRTVYDQEVIDYFRQRNPDIVIC